MRVERGRNNAAVVCVSPLYAAVSAFRRTHRYSRRENFLQLARECFADATAGAFETPDAIQKIGECIYSFDKLYCPKYVNWIQI